MTSQEIKSLTHQYIMNTYGRFPVALDHGEGATLYDPEGREYIDCTSGIGGTALGYGNQPWAEAVADHSDAAGDDKTVLALRVGLRDLSAPRRSDRTEV